MKHAGAAALDRLEPLLQALRTRAALKEKARGTFYHRGRALLHFHEHGEELFADVWLNEDFERLPATTEKDRHALLRKLDRAIGDA